MRTLLISWLIICWWGAAMAQPSGLRLGQSTFRGDGCPAGSLVTLLSADAQALTFLFSDYVASTEPLANGSEQRKACDIRIDLEVEDGWQLSLATADFRGFAYLENGVRATQRSSYSFQGTGQGPPFRMTLDGPYNNDFLLRSTLEGSEPFWSPCSRRRRQPQLRLMTSLQVQSRGSGGSGFIGLDSIDQAVQQTYYISWRRCR